MKHILQVLKFEYLNCIKNKAFIITTVIIMILILGMSFVPAIIMDMTKSDGDTVEGEMNVIGIIDNAYNDSDLITKSFEKVYPHSAVMVTKESIDEVKAKVDKAEYTFGVVINSPISFTYVTKNNSLMGEEIQTITSAVQSIYRAVNFEKFGVDHDRTSAILDAPIIYETVTTGTDQTKNYFSTYVLVMILYMAIVMYGQMVSQSVVTEKNTRAMEMLITCAKPTHLMFGKVLGSGLAGLTQLVVIMGTALVSIKTISMKSLPEGMSEMLTMPVSTVIYALIFFITAYFIYAFLLGSLSSLASRSEDLNTLTTPVMMIFVAAFMIVMVSMTSDINNTLMIVCSYIPFTAPIAMFARIALSDVAFYEIIISIAVQVVSIYLLGMLAAAIYKIGVLMYGKPPKFSEIFKLLKEQHRENKALKAKE